MNSPAKLGGLAMLLAGALMGIGLAIHPNEQDPASVGMPMWGPAHWLVTLASILAIFGFTALYVRWLKSEGSMGLLAFVLMVGGMALLTAVAMIEAGIVAPLAARPEAATLLAMDGPIFGGPLSTIFLLLTAMLAVGSALTGYLLFKGKQVPQAAALIVLIGGIVVSLSQWLPFPIAPISGGLLGIGMAWIGYIMWSEA